MAKNAVSYLYVFLLSLIILFACGHTERTEFGKLYPFFTAGTWGYMDKAGNTIIEPQFDGADGFSEGLAVVMVGSKWGYINKLGKIVIEPQFEGSGKFSQGSLVSLLTTSGCT